MMPTDRFERELPQLLAELAEPRTPDYLDDLLRQTAHTSQRPAWSFLERWLPMLDVARRPVLAPPVPWRSIGLAIALIALLVAMVAALAIGSRKPLPEPFGPARNGLVAYASNGDIYTADPVTGTSTAIVTGPAFDLNPTWSLDGTRLAFARQQEAGSALGTVHVANADGTNPLLLTPEPLSDITDVRFSPDGSRLLIVSGPFWDPMTIIAATDGSSIEWLNLDQRPMSHTAWRPPDGAELLFMENGDYNNGFGGLFVLNLDTGQIRTIFERELSRFRASPMWSPDGSQIAYTEWLDASSLTAQVHIVAADGSGDRMLPLPPGALWQAARSWSNDGTRLLVVRGDTGGFEQSVAVAVPVDGSGFGVEIDYPGSINQACCSSWEWSPDDSFILGTPTNGTGASLDQVLLDPVEGTATAVPWSSTSRPSWQRLGR